MLERGNINIVAAVADNSAIGRGNSLLWHLPADMKFFRELTTGGTVVMGRKTYESIGRPLPRRRNIVITRSSAWNPEGQCSTPTVGGLKVVNSLEDALAEAEGEVFVLGGGEIYAQAMGLADRLYITHVHLSPQGADTFFPDISPDVWEEVGRSETMEEEGVRFEFVTYERRCV